MVAVLKGEIRLAAPPSERFGLFMRGKSRADPDKSGPDKHANAKARMVGLFSSPRGTMRGIWMRSIDVKTGAFFQPFRQVELLIIPEALETAQRHAVGSAKDDQLIGIIGIRRFDMGQAEMGEQLSRARIDEMSKG